MLGMAKNQFYTVLLFFVFLAGAENVVAQRSVGSSKRHVLRKGNYRYRTDPTYLDRVYRRVKEISLQCRYPCYPCRPNLGEQCVSGPGMFIHFEYERSDVDFFKVGVMNIDWGRYPSAFTLDYQFAPSIKTHGVELRAQQFFLQVNRVYLFALGASFDLEFRQDDLVSNFKPYLGLTLPIRSLSQLQFSYGYNLPVSGAVNGFNSYFVDWKIPILFN